MSSRPTAEQINDALTRAAKAAQEHTKYPSRVLKSPLPQHGSEPRGERRWLIGWIRVLGEPEDWDVLYDPVTDEGRLRGEAWTVDSWMNKNKSGQRQPRYRF